jgi:hypothetical protein
MDWRWGSSLRGEALSSNPSPTKKNATKWVNLIKLHLYAWMKISQYDMILYS